LIASSDQAETLKRNSMTMKLTTIIVAGLVAGGPTSLSGTGSWKFGGSTPGVTGRN
jgi:hypothetical protein